MGEACNTHGRGQNAYNTLVGKSKGKRPFGIKRSKRNNAFRIYMKGEGQEGVELIHPAQKDKVSSCYECGNET